MTSELPRGDQASAYAEMLATLDEIEQALDLQDAELIGQLALGVERCLEQIKHYDRELGQSVSAEHRAQMEALLARNQALTVRIGGITALQRNELSQLKIGLDTAKGYASYHSKRTGSIINSSN